MKTPKQKRSKNTVNNIIESGFICVSERGVAGMTTHDIAEKAGVGVGTVYDYFENKEDIIYMMSERLFGELVVLIERVTPQMIEYKLEAALVLLLEAFEAFLMQNNGRYLKFAKEMSVQDSLQLHTRQIRQTLLNSAVKLILRHPEYVQIPNLYVMASIIIDAGIYLVLDNLSSAKPEVSFEQLKAGLSDLIHVYVSHYVSGAG
jgi:AcrR family transcriptional regulator